MSHDLSDHLPRPPGLRRSTLRFTLLGVACIALGLLIWSRLLLVTNYPRTAIADPPHEQLQQGQGAGQSVHEPLLRGGVGPNSSIQSD